MNKELIIEVFKKAGAILANDVQEKADSMTGTELNNEFNFIPDFSEAVKKKNMLERKAGFVCKSSAGRVVKLLQVYDSTIYTGEPETLPSQWGFVWSDEPKHAKEFVSLATSPYMKNNCCIENGVIYRSKIDNNVHAPSSYAEGWEIVNGY